MPNTWPVLSNFHILRLQILLESQEIFLPTLQVYCMHFAPLSTKPECIRDSYISLLFSSFYSLKNKAIICIVQVRIVRYCILSTVTGFEMKLIIFPFRNTQRLMHLPWIMKTTFRTWISRSDWSQLQGAGASQSTMEAPICLVQNWKEQLTVNPEAIRILEKISQPLVVVAIVGLYRTGKSYLMNHLAGQNHGECPSDAWRPFTWISGRW